MIFDPVYRYGKSEIYEGPIYLPKGHAAAGAPAPPPQILLTPTTLFSDCDEGQDAAAQTFTVRNAAGGTLNYSISDNAAWLSVSPTSGSSTGEMDTITVTYDSDTLLPGVHIASIIITDPAAAISPLTVLVVLIVLGYPEIDLSTNHLDVEVDEGEDAESQSFAVANGHPTSTQPLDVSITVDQPWLSVDPISADSTGEADLITVNFNTDALGPGTYNATITVSDPNASNNPQTITVTLTVNATALYVNIVGLVVRPFTPEAYWVLDHNSAMSRATLNSNGYFAGLVGNGFVPTDVINEPGAALPPYVGQGYIIHMNYDEIDQKIFAGDIGEIAALATLIDFGGGYRLRLGDQVIAVNEGDPLIPGTPAPGDGTIGLSVSGLFPAAYVGNNAPAQSFNVRNSGVGTLSYTIADDVAWLSVAPASGSSTGENDTIVVTYNTSALGANVYWGHITVTAPGATNTPRTIIVGLVISEIPVATIELSTAAIDVECLQGNDAGAEAFTIRNSGTENLHYEMTCSQSWFTVSPTSGNDGGEGHTIDVTFDTSGLSAGIHTGTITIVGTSDVYPATNTPQVISVSVTVAPLIVEPASVVQVEFNDSTTISVIFDNPSIAISNPSAAFATFVVAGVAHVDSASETAPGTWTLILDTPININDAWAWTSDGGYINPPVDLPDSGLVIFA